jgi:hypothetical protein
MNTIEETVSRIRLGINDTYQSTTLREKNVEWHYCECKLKIFLDFRDRHQTGNLEQHRHRVDVECRSTTLIFLFLILSNPTKTVAGRIQIWFSHEVRSGLC